MVEGRRPIDINGDDLGAALFTGADGMRHHIDLGCDRIRSPNHHAIGKRHLARIRPHHFTRACEIAGPSEVDADGRIKARIFFDVGKPFNAVAVHQPHSARVKIGPDGFRAVLCFNLQQALSNFCHRIIPRDAGKLARAFRAASFERVEQSVWMVIALRIAGNFGANHACGVGLGLGAVDTADRLIVQHFHFQRAGGGAIMRTDGIFAGDTDGRVHGERLHLRARQAIDRFTVD